MSGGLGLQGQFPLVQNTQAPLLPLPPWGCFAAEPGAPSPGQMSAAGRLPTSAPNAYLSCFVLPSDAELSAGRPVRPSPAGSHGQKV